MSYLLSSKILLSLKIGSISQFVVELDGAYGIRPMERQVESHLGQGCLYVSFFGTRSPLLIRHVGSGMVHRTDK
jgi:hypothetical protein